MHVLYSAEQHKCCNTEGRKNKRKKDEPNRSVLNNIPPDITFINGIRYRNAMK